MTKDQALKLALEALEKQIRMANGWQSPAEAKAITAIKEALAQDELCSSQEPVAWPWLIPSPLEQPEPVHHAVIAGALFDFMGWLTSRKERLVLSSADEASPAVDAIRDFAKMRGLSLDDAKVQDWQDMARGRNAP